MSHWNYRIVRSVFGEEETFAIHEAYYDDKGRVWAISKEPDGVQAETYDALGKVLLLMQGAFVQPVLDYDAIPEPGAISPHATGELNEKLGEIEELK